MKPERAAELRALRAHVQDCYLNDRPADRGERIRFVGGTRKDGTKWRLADKKGFLFLAPLILAINIIEACIRDFEVGTLRATPAMRPAV